MLYFAYIWKLWNRNEWNTLSPVSWRGNFLGNAATSEDRAKCVLWNCECCWKNATKTRFRLRQFESVFSRNLTCDLSKYQKTKEIFPIQFLILWHPHNKTNNRLQVRACYLNLFFRHHGGIDERSRRNPWRELFNLSSFVTIRQFRTTLKLKVPS